jgi:hypothetical protein
MRARVGRVEHFGTTGKPQIKVGLTHQPKSNRDQFPQADFPGLIRAWKPGWHPICRRALHEGGDIPGGDITKAAGTKGVGPEWLGSSLLKHGKARYLGILVPKTVRRADRKALRSQGNI